ncbi:universal stress protein [Persephonella atlantica]|uniref:Universal stress protein n=1 Tax=Persephonella atlantica TaxID=2699429 RepID=A0ABS1GJ77_9AQUI|nr:universal stress protein [Persephonella atlantica]MBK3332968.1 universal stress protein [Persephonella atlantica]
MQFKKILVGVDFSDVTEAVINSAVFIGKIFDAQIKLVHVVENTIFPVALDEIEPLIDPEEFQMIVKKVEEITKISGEKLEEISEKIRREKGLKTSFSVVTGDIAEELLEIGEQGNFDLIVIGAHKNTFSESLLLGNEAEKIVNKARFSVLVVKGRGLKEINRILVGYDFLPNSIEALETAKEIAQKTGAEIDIVHADTEEGFAHFSHIYESVFQKKIELLKQLVEKLRKEKIEADFEIIKTSPDRAIVEAIDDFGSDIVIVGKRQRKDIKRFFLGTIAMKVVKNSTVPVLIARKR